MASQVFQFRYSDTLGAADITQAQAWFNTSLLTTRAQSCMVRFNRAAKLVMLLDDGGTAWNSAVAGTSVTLQNSQCAIAVGDSGAALNGNSRWR
jgi:hypothetical protein